jgi:hypothetical protein
VSDKAVRLQAVLSWLETGKVTLADACERIRDMKLAGPPDRSTSQVLAADANGDIPVPDGDTFSEISHAYTSGRITRHQYEQLAEAVSRA